jgi:serine/threonine protein kinase
MRPVDDKRVTQILVDAVLAPKQSASDTEAVVPSPPELNNKRRGALPSNGRLVKRTAAPSSIEPGGKTIQGLPRALALPAICESGNSAGSDLVIRQELPWDTFEKYYECDLAGTVAVCVRRSARRAVCAIRQYPSKDANRILDILRSVHHKNVVAVWECFRSPDTPDTIYALSKFHPLTLDHVVACKAFPNQQQLAAIMSQVLPSSPRIQRSLIIFQFVEGLSYLIEQNLQHTSLDCSSILMSLEGDVQIGNPIA